VGKSAVARELCGLYRAEVLVADAVQVYRHMDIGANKPTADERAAAPHHLLDLCEPPNDVFTAGDFVRAAAPLVREISGRGRLPLLVGGNTMWTQWLVTGVPDAPKYSTANTTQLPYNAPV
jgi:tRNA dimethylallyltransferase